MCAHYIAMNWAYLGLYISVGLIALGAIGLIIRHRDS
jgi:hypothetical protein